MKNNLAAFILLTTASAFAAGIPTDPTTVFDLAAETAELAAPAAGSSDSDASLSPEFQFGRHHRCYWSGTGPFCIGHCGHGYTETRRNQCGNGLCCWIGSKALCCRRGRRSQIYPPIPHHQGSNSPPRQHLHGMPQVPTKKNDLSHYNLEGSDNDGFDELGDSQFLGGSEGLSAFGYVNRGFGGSDEYELERSSGEKGPENLEGEGIEQYKEDSSNEAQPEF
ncbi:hypothetical protein BJ912DRAFT_976732 [Pholiota molesta]|nr:hypothetical protein BJ912DRAFT_976732 [Pholiota molesta]